MSSELDLNAIRRHFPAAGEGGNFRIDTDSNCLIIRRVLINGKPYDIRVWRYDADLKLIKVSEQSLFSRQTIYTVQNLARDIFQNYIGSNPEQTKLFYSDLNPKAPKCWQENLAAETEEEKFDALIETREDGSVKKHPIVPLLAEIHNQFKDMGNSYSFGPDASAVLLSPMLVPEEKELLPFKKEEPAPALKHEAETETLPIPPTQIGQPVVTNTDAATETQENDLSETFTDALDRASQTAPRTNPFKEISYLDLSKYSTEKRGDEKLGHAYQVYTNLLKSGSEEDAELKAMKEWLHHHYLAMYKECEKLKDLWQASEQTKTFEEWCKYYAASTLLGFIRVEKQSIDRLRDELIESAPIPKVAPVVVAKPWYQKLNPRNYF